MNRTEKDGDALVKRELLALIVYQKRAESVIAYYTKEEEKRRHEETTVDSHKAFQPSWTKIKIQLHFYHLN